MTASSTAPRAAEALARLSQAADPERAAKMAKYHRAPRRYLGLSNPEIDAAVAAWRASLDARGRVALAATLWDSDVHEARIAAAKLLTQARLGDDDPRVWAEFLRWVPGFDTLAISDQACKAGERRLVSRPERLDTVETWILDPNPWVRRAAIVATLPWTRNNHPGPAEIAARERVLGWMERLAADRDRFVQRSIGTWLRSLSTRDPDRARAFLERR